MESIKKFEINNDILKDFDKLMSMQLNEVEELKVTSIDGNSKLLNIVSLCINVKTLIIEGDQRINTNNIVLNICKPELVENLVLTNVKLPSGYALKRLSNLKLVSLNNIRFSNIGAFLKEMPSANILEGLNFYNVDYEKNSIDILNKYTSIKYLSMENVTNCKLENIEFLSQNTNLQKLIISNNNIDIKDINNLLKGKYTKLISLNINSEKDYKVKSKFTIDESGKVSIIINSSELEKITQNLNLYKIDKLTLIIEDNTCINQYIKKLKNVKEEVKVAISDLSYLSSEDAQKLKERLKIDSISIIDINNESLTNNSYEIDYYIRIKETINKYTNMVSKYEPEVKKFLDIYKILRENLIENNNMYAEILQNCLISLNIESNIIKGKLRETNETHMWNQVKLNDKWYNVDLSLDVLGNNRSFKRKVNYCLLDDREFCKTHIPESGVVNYALECYDQKIVNVYFKTGLFSRSYINSYFQNILKKIKVITSFNRQKALPVGNVNNEENNKSDSE